jgi:nucleotide-binding universal stress UspA family protein
MDSTEQSFSAFGHVVLATDFSPASSAALLLAGKAARLFKARLTVLHVFQYPIHHGYPVRVRWMVELLRHDIKGKMDEATRRLGELGVEAEAVMIEDGFPSEEIPAYVALCKNPLVFVGTHAVGGMDRFLLGSTAEEILRESPCPVVTTGPNVRSTGALDACFSRVLYATDCSEASLKAVPTVALLRRVLPGALRVLHVVTPHEKDALSDRERLAPVREALESSEWNSSPAPEEYVTLHGAEVSQAIVNEAERYPADLIVLGVHRATALASHLGPKLAFQVIASAPCPVLTVAS